MPKQSKHYGLGREEWSSLFLEVLPNIVEACTSVAANVHAEPADREMACRILGDYVNSRLVPTILPCGSSVPEMLRDVATSLANGRPVELDQAQRDLCTERLKGVHLFHGTLGPLLHGNAPDEVEAAEAPALPSGAN